MATTSTKQALVTAPVGQWAWNDVPGSHCGLGQQTGFAVNLGTSNDVFIYMLGGGACWDEFTCGLSIGGTATAGGTPLAYFFEEGYDESTFFNVDWAHRQDLFDRNNPDSPYKDATWIYIPYCTGDLHTGSTTQWFSGKQKTAYFAGRQNLDLFLDRIVPAFPNAGRVTLAGSSAGGLGAQANYEHVRQRFGVNKRMDLVADSGPFLYNSPFVGSGMNAWNLAAALPAGCTNCASNVRNIYSYYDTTYPDSRFAFMINDMDIVISTAYLELFYPVFNSTIKGFATNTLQPLLHTRFFIPDAIPHGLLYNGLDAQIQPRKCTPGFLGSCNPVSDGAPTRLRNWLKDMTTDSSNWKNVTGMIMDQCVPSCGGAQCGADGCGGVCGNCGPDMSCHPSLQCLYNKGCTINGVNYDSGAKNPALSCQVCDPSANPFGWTIAANSCLINGQCKTEGDVDSVTGCTTCKPGVSKTSWSLNSSCNVVAVTNSTVTGDMGYANAVSSCASLGANLGLVGTWKPLLATGSQNYIDLVSGDHKSKPVVNLHGEQLFPSWNAIFTNQVWPSGTSVYAFDNTAYTGKVWTGAAVGGAASDRCTQTWNYPSGEGWSVKGYWTFLNWVRPPSYVGDFGPSTRNFYSAASEVFCDESHRIACVLDGPVASVSITPTNGFDVVTEPTWGMFTLTRTGPTTSALTVNLTMGGTATYGTDYVLRDGNSPWPQIGLSVTIPAGASTAYLVVGTIDDTLVEGPETVIANINSSTTGSYSLGIGSATVKILDND